MDKKYNGWENWETWNVNLWLNNDEGSYKRSKECKTPKALQEMVEGWAEEMGLFDKGMFTDLLTTELNKVNWQEIFNGLHED